MEIFLPSEQAARIKDGAEARLTFDALPGVAFAGYVSFVSPEAQFTPKQVETKSEREKFMFRVKIRVPEETVEAAIDRVKTGVRGVGYVKLDDFAAWPASLREPNPGGRCGAEEERTGAALRPPQARVLRPQRAGEPVHGRLSVQCVQGRNRRRAGRVDQGVTHRYGKTLALDGLSLDIPERAHGRRDRPGRRRQIDAAGAGRRLQEDAAGQGDRARRRHRRRAHRREACPRIAYMPQGLGKNLYLELSVRENVDFMARLFGLSAEERPARIKQLLDATGLGPFPDRPAGKLSGGMKQKVGFCGALVHEPDLLILDEPTTGVDPLSRRQFWSLIDDIRAERPSMSVVISTAYMDEAERWDWIVAMDAGRVLATGTPAELMERTGTKDLERCFVALLPEEKRTGHVDLTIPPRPEGKAEIAIDAKGLTRRFGDFVAVDHVSLTIERGEIFGFLGSNGCGKSTTMKMLTGLLPPTEGSATLFGQSVEAGSMEVRKSIGYMTQAFSL